MKATILMHDNNIYHKDIKPENILIIDNNCFLSGITFLFIIAYF